MSDLQLGKRRRKRGEPKKRNYRTPGYFAQVERKRKQRAAQPIRGSRLSSMAATHANFQRRVDEFFVSLKDAAIEGRPAYAWLGSEEPLAREIRALAWCLWNWPAPYAPWAILESSLDKVEALITRGV